MNGRKAKAHRKAKRTLALQLAAASLQDTDLVSEQRLEEAAQAVDEMASWSDARFYPAAVAFTKAIEQRSKPIRSMTHVTPQP